MLKKVFTELDNDFITIWSRILLPNKKEETDVLNDLERLAELGQVNAVQTFYSVAEKEKKNLIISKSVDNYPDDDFECLIAKTYKKQCEENYKGLSSEFIRSILRNDFENQDKIKNQMLHLESFQLLCKTKKCCLEEYNKTKDPLILQRFFEIASASTPWANLDENEIFKKNYNSVRKKLVAKLQDNPDNLEVLFALAKNMYFSSYYTLFPKTRQGKQILAKFKSRPYSKTLQQHINQFNRENNVDEKTK